jgi:Tfp pilus assembly protein PilF
MAAICCLAGCAQQSDWLAGDWDAQRLSAWAGGEMSSGTPQEIDDASKGPLALARLSERRGQTKQAEHLYQKMIERYPEGVLPYHRLGVMKSRAGQWDEAEPYFEQALRLDPDSPDLLADVGYFYYLQSKPEPAEQHLRRALKIAPNHAKSCNNLAILLGEQRRDEECMDLFRRTGSEAEVYCNMAFIYAQRGELNLAIEAYSRALSFDDSLRPAAEAMAQLARYAPPAKSPDGTSPDASETQPEGSRLVYTIEQKGNTEARLDNHVQPASAELVVASLTDGGEPEPTGPGNAPSPKPTRKAPERLRLVSEPAALGDFPTAWHPPVSTLPGANLLKYSQSAGTPLTDGQPAVTIAQPPVLGSLPTGRIGDATTRK